MSIGFAAFPFVPGEPDALTWEQTLELADYALNLTKRRKRNSYTGLRARAGLTAAAVLAFLAAGRGAPLPEEMEVVLPDEREGGEPPPPQETNVKIATPSRNHHTPNTMP